MIDLSSDTQTQPTDAMRVAMCQASVGDEQAQMDPTVSRLCSEVAMLTGQERAMFLPSGTMSNLVAAATWTSPGDAVVVGGVSHSLESEAASFGAIAGVVPVPIHGDGRFDGATLTPFLDPGDRVRPNPTLVVMEQTVNFAGGIVWTNEMWVDAVDVANTKSVPVHVDGARIFNAVETTGIPLDQWTAGTNSVYIDFTKGLGAPFGSVLAGSADFIDEAWRWKHRLGGAMRQAGIMAAACLYALEHHVGRLGADHERAHQLHAALRSMGCEASEPETNMVWFVPPSDQPLEAFVSQLERRGVRLTVLRNRLRAVTHLDIDDDDINQAAQIIEGCIQ